MNEDPKKLLKTQSYWTGSQLHDAMTTEQTPGKVLLSPDLEKINLGNKNKMYEYMTAQGVL